MSYIDDRASDPFVPIKPGIPKPAWIDGDGSSGSSEAEGNLELIEAITTTSDQYSLIYNKEPNGDSYRFKALGIIINTKKGEATDDLAITGLYNKNIVQNAIIRNGLSSEGNKYGVIKMYQSHGVWEAVGSLAVDGYTQTIEYLTGQSIMYTFSTNNIEYPYIDEVRIAPKVNGNKIPKGTYIQIFAVRS